VRGIEHDLDAREPLLDHRAKPGRPAGEHEGLEEPDHAGGIVPLDALDQRGKQLVGGKHAWGLASHGSARS
jgi:hypothetical protein